MNTSNNHQALVSIKNQKILSDIERLNQKTALADFCNSTDWNTYLPNKNMLNVLLLMAVSGTDKRQFICRGRIVFIDGVMFIQDNTREFLDLGLLIGWMIREQAQNLSVEVRRDIKALDKKTPLAHKYTGDVWNTNLPEKDTYCVLLLLFMPSTNDNKVIYYGHIVFINGVMRIKDSSGEFIQQSLLIGWVDQNKALGILGY